MGVYIPPPSGSGRGSDDSTSSTNHNSENADANSNANSNANSYTVNLSRIPTVNKILSTVFPNHRFPQNPSFGLRMWGPLVPASDNRLALYGLATFQVMMGMYFLGRARSLRKVNFLRAGLPYPKGRFRDNVILVGVGSAAVFQSGLEYSRLVLLGDMDPWSVEAAHYREEARTKDGESASWWFGAYDRYVPMSLDEYRKALRRYIEKNENYMRKSGKAFNMGQVLDQHKYLQVYENMVEQNRKVRQELLDGHLKDMTELNKAERLDKILEGSADVDVDEIRPKISLGNHNLDTDDDLDFVWLYVNPWEDLNGSDILLRILPKSVEREEVLQMHEEEDSKPHTHTHPHPHSASITTHAHPEDSRVLDTEKD